MVVSEVTEETVATEETVVRPARVVWEVRKVRQQPAVSEVHCMLVVLWVITSPLEFFQILGQRVQL